MRKLVFLFLLSIPFLALAQKNCEKWKVYEVSLNGPAKGNPFQEVVLTATFTNGSTKADIEGFYDGNGQYKIRFMPAMEGKWTYLTQSNQKVLNGKKGEFICTPPTSNNHGPVLVKDTFYLAYADGKPHHSFGTTCYGWVHQGDSLAMLTLQTLSNGYFNKMRMCIFPKDYDWNKNEPPLYPFEGKPLKDWDYARFNPAYFRNIEKRIAQLDSMGIEADLIVFHPYDRWGYQSLDRDTENRYIKYIIARFAAYKNVWWSMANEYDFMRSKKMEDWHHYIEYFSENDPYQRLRGIHNGSVWYDHTNPLITHASIQSEETHRAKELRMKYKKPVIFDECRYEGNIPWSWGNLTPEEMVNKFWRGVINGGYVGHGDTYVTEQPLQWPNKSSEVLWWSKGGVMKGKSQDRIRFLKEIIEEAPGYLRPATIFQAWMPFSSLTYNNEYFLTYFNRDQPRSMIFNLPKDADFKVEIIDAWNMTIHPVEGKFSGHCMVELPQKPMTALRFTKINQTTPPSLKLIYQHPEPVITTNHPDALNNKFGFEGGTVVKIDSIYHLFTSEMIDNPMWVKMRLAHWKSSDRINWERVSTIRESSGEFEGIDPRAALWSPMVVFDPEENRWNLFYVAYNAAPSYQNRRTLNMKGKIYRSVSEVQGINGINGPFIDQGIILSYDKDPDPWEGLQGTDSFYPYQVGKEWYAFYGSCHNEKAPVKQWLVGYAKSETGFIGGPWKRLSERNPSQIEKVFIENPIVSKVDEGYLVIYDSKQPDAMGWAFSEDGINWSDGQPLIIQNQKGVWAKNVRTVLGLVDEGDGKYTVFYTGFEENPDWDKLFLGIGSASCAIGFVELGIQ